MPPLWKQRRNLRDECIQLALQIYDRYDSGAKRQMLESLAIALTGRYSLEQLKQWKEVLEGNVILKDKPAEYEAEP